MREDILDLINQNTKLNSLEEFNNRYTNPIHKTREEDGKYIAHLGADIRELSSSYGDLKAAFMVDNVVDEEKRKQGIFTQLYREFESENKDIDVFYGFPLQFELLNLVDKQGYKIVGEALVYAKVLNSKEIMKSHSFLSVVVNLINKFKDRRAKSIDTTGVDVRSESEILNPLDIVSKSNMRNKFSSKRTKAFLEKRCKDHIEPKILVASKAHTDVGYLIYKFVERNDIKYYMILDLVCDDDITTTALLNRVIDIGRENEVSLIGIWENLEYLNTIKRLGFSFAKSTIPFVAKDPSDKLDIKKMSNWYLQPIEGEIY